LQKSPDHQLGTISVSTHRLFYVDQHKMFTHSFAMDMSLVTKTEYYAGLFKSSPKITLYLSGGNTVSTSANAANNSLLDEFENWECEVCSYRNPPGLSPAAARICALCGVPRNSLHTPSNKSSAPSTRPVSPDVRDGDDDDEEEPKNRVIKISFRKGGDKAFYSVLRRSLLAKAWEVREDVHHYPPTLTSFIRPKASGRDLKSVQHKVWIRRRVVMLSVDLESVASPFAHCHSVNIY
jgi:ESCRT-II complex subunit VPS36